jgi:hypothetical protein
MRGVLMETEKVDARPRYELPRITPMDRDEVLQAFQMTAAQISAAGCWWTSACTGTPCTTPAANPA